MAQARRAGEAEETGGLLNAGADHRRDGGLIFVLTQAAIFRWAFLVCAGFIAVEAGATTSSESGVRPAAIAIYALLGWLIAMERTGAVLELQLATNGANVGLGIGSFMLDGVFIGATRTRDLRNAMTVSVLVYAGALALLLPGFGNHGLWVGLMVRS